MLAQLPAHYVESLRAIAAAPTAGRLHAHTTSSSTHAALSLAFAGLLKQVRDAGGSSRGILPEMMQRMSGQEEGGSEGTSSTSVGVSDVDRICEHGVAADAAPVARSSSADAKGGTDAAADAHSVRRGSTRSGLSAPGPRVADMRTLAAMRIQESGLFGSTGFSSRQVTSHPAFRAANALREAQLSSGTSVKAALLQQLAHATSAGASSGGASAGGGAHAYRGAIAALHSLPSGDRVELLRSHSRSGR